MHRELKVDALWLVRQVVEDVMKIISIYERDNIIKNDQPIDLTGIANMCNDISRTLLIRTSL